MRTGSTSEGSSEGNELILPRSQFKASVFTEAFFIPLLLLIKITLRMRIGDFALGKASCNLMPLNSNLETLLYSILRKIVLTPSL